MVYDFIGGDFHIKTIKTKFAMTIIGQNYLKYELNVMRGFRGLISLCVLTYQM